MILDGCRVGYPVQQCYLFIASVATQTPVEDRVAAYFSAVPAGLAVHTHPLNP
jgi:hypothetical protein